MEKRQILETRCEFSIIVWFLYFASFDVVCYYFDNGVWDVCRSFPVSLCMFTTVSKAFLVSRATVIVLAGGVI